MADTDSAKLLNAWQQGDLSHRDLYQALRVPMYQFAARGIVRITSRSADGRDVEEAVFAAFRELLERDPESVHSLVGLAKTIAYRRGQDRGRAVVRLREQVQDLANYEDSLADPELTPEELSAAEEQEALAIYAEQCLETLTGEQRDVVEATIKGDESLSDWAHRNGKQHQSASRQRLRALQALQRCVEKKRDREQRERGHNDERQR